MKQKDGFYHRYRKEWDLQDIVNMNLRDMDRKILHEVGCSTWQEALEFTLRQSNETYVIRNDADEVAGVFGVSFNGDTSHPWILVSKDKFKELSTAFITVAKEEFRKLVEGSKQSVIVVPDEDKDALRLVRWLGFIPYPSPIDKQMDRNILYKRHAD